MGSNRNTYIKIENMTDLRFAMERFRHEAEMKEQVILSNLGNMRMVLVNSTRQKIASMGQRLMLFSLINFVRKKFRRKHHTAD